MKKIGKCRVFADHYQFYILDADADPLEGMPEWTKETVSRGFIANQHVVGISTRAHLNDHWIELWSSDSAPDVSGFDRATACDLLLQSGRVAVTGFADLPDEVYQMEVPPGLYTVHVLASNLGVDQFSVDSVDDREMADEEIESRMDLERYRVVLVPKQEGTTC